MHKDLLEIFEILEHSFLPKHFQKSICSGVFSPMDCRLWSYKFIKRKLSYTRFSGKFPSFWCSFFKTLSWKHLWWSWQFRLSTKFLSSLKSNSTRNSFLTFLEMKLSSKKRLWMIPIVVATYNISKSRMVQRRCPSAYCGKC